MRRPNSPQFSSDSLSNVSVPTLVVVGENDFVFRPTNYLMLFGQKLITLSGVDHFATPKNFGFIDAALDFLEAQPF